MARVAADVERWIHTILRAPLQRNVHFEILDATPLWRDAHFDFAG